MVRPNTGKPFTRRPGSKISGKYIARAGGAEHNSPEQFLANINETDHGHDIKMSVRSDGSFTMTNERTGFTKEYPVRAAVRSISQASGNK